MLSLVKLLTELLYNQSRISEFILGAATFLWGLWVWSPTSNAFDIVSYYAFRSSGMNEVGWGIVVGVVGLLTMASAILGKEPCRAVSLILEILTWVLLAFLFLLSIPNNPSIPIYFMMGILSAWFYIRLLLFSETDKHAVTLVTSAALSKRSKEEVPRSDTIGSKKD